MTRWQRTYARSPTLTSAHRRRLGDRVVGGMLTAAAGLILVAAVTATVGCGVLVPLLNRWSLVDVPGDRSSHIVAVPRGGGLALMAGVAVAAFVADRDLLETTTGEHATTS